MLKTRRIIPNRRLQEKLRNNKNPYYNHLRELRDLLRQHIRNVDGSNENPTMIRTPNGAYRVMGGR